ncbi:MAG: D-aminoacylase [Bacteroidales bacterium]|nr:D-aminoacylase [Bacteroidales bacterium]
MKYNRTIFFLFTALILGCSTPESYDVIIRNGQIIDGTGSPSFIGDIGINADTITKIGTIKNATGQSEIDAQGLVVAPGFINMLSWATESLIEDGRSQSDIRQGVTLEVMGEGESMGPLNDWLKQEMKEAQQDIKFDIEWTTLSEYLEFLERKGVSTNITSFLGNASLRLNVMGYENRPPTKKEMDEMKDLTRQAMEGGAVGLSTALVYVPSGHANTEEIIELAKVVAEYDGMYISHIRDEESGLLNAMDELIAISREANIRSEIYHFKASGNENWHLMDQAIKLIENARNEGLKITTDMYMYNASSTGLNFSLPAWAKEGGHDVTMEMIAKPELKAKMIKEITFHVPPEKILLVGFKNKKLRHLIGKTLAEIATERGKSPEETVVNLIYEDDSRIQAVYFSMSEENIKKKIALPFMSFCSDAGSYATEGVFLNKSTHPRAYGSFARLLGKYVREEKIITLEEAIRKLSSQPAQNLRIKKRGMLKKGYFADIVIFDPDKILDNATFKQPHQYATGMIHVLVNGKQVLKDGEHTGALPGRVVRGPGWKINK